MASLNEPVTLSPEQIKQLTAKLSHLRHSINNHLALISAAGEILQFQPEAIEKLAPTLIQRPADISQEIRNFSVEFEKILGVHNP